MFLTQKGRKFMKNKKMRQMQKAITSNKALKNIEASRLTAAQLTRSNSYKGKDNYWYTLSIQWGKR